MANQEALIIKDSGGTEADVTASNALKVDGSAVTQPISDGGGSITVDGPLTDVQLRATPVPVSGTVTTIPSGTQNVDVVGNTIGLATQATLATIDADTSVLAGAVAGSEMQVDIVAALPTGTNTIGSVKITDGTDVADIVPLGTQVVTADKGIVTNTVIHGLNSGGGGAYVDVKVNPSGSLQIALGDITGVDGQATMANSLPVVIASDQSAVPISAASLPLPSGAATAALQTQPGVDIGDVTINNGAGASAVNIQDGGNSITIDGIVAVSSISAGTNYIGKVRPTDGVTDAEIVPLAGYNAQAVAIVDGAGAQITSFGGGTQYTEDAVAATDPVGTVQILVADSTPALEVAEGDNVAQRGTRYGAAYTQIVTSAGALVDSFGGGTQYTEGDIDASVTGTAIMWEDTSDTMRVASASKPLPVALDGQVSGLVSTVNSSVAALAGGATFTGTYEDVSNYSSVTLMIYTTVASATDGVIIQWSNDAVNIVLQSLYTHTTSEPSQTLVIPRAAKYARVKYTNGGSLQPFMQLQTILNKYVSTAPNERPKDSESNEQSLGNTSAHLSVFNGATWDRVRGNIKYGIGVDTANNLGTLFRGQSATFRTPGRAGTTGQKILALHNATGSSISLQVNSITVDMWATVVKAVTVAPPIVRIWKFTAVPTNGTNLTKNKVGGTTTSNASITLWGDASADGTGSATTLTVTLPAGTILDSKVASRIITAVGEVNTRSLEFKWDGGIELAPLEGICVFLDYTVATQNPVTDMWVASINWKEYTT